MRRLLLTFTVAACGRLGFEAPAGQGASDDAAAKDALGEMDDGAAPKPTWVRACTGAATPASTFDAFPPWAIMWRDPNSATLTVAIEAGTLRINGSPRALAFAGIRSSSATVFRDRRVTAEVVTVPGGQHLLFLGVDRLGGVGSDFLRVMSDGGSLRFIVNDGGSGTEDVVVPYDAVEHRYWQVREQGGMSMLETSPDDVTYVTHRAVPTPAFVDSGLLVLGMGSELDGPGNETGRFGSIEACPI